MEFIVPSGVVLGNFEPTFVPVIGYDEDRGVDDENELEPPDYDPDRYRRVLPPLFGNGHPYRTRIEVTAPEAFRINSVGTLERESVRDGRRTVVWVSDHPLRFFNVVAGRWAVRRGEGTAIYYHPEHAHNLDEMGAVLDGARRWYSEWFYPYPWRELKLSEFPGLATYAQGFPTNITFSESIGFLTKPDPKTNTVALVTAHESAHQWWGNLLTPGHGPGGNILSEGMAHFSTALLLEKLKGERARLEFLKRIEERYGEERRADDERPLVRIDGSRPTDQTITYDKGGWVAWMLMGRMGREPFLDGVRRFIETYRDGPDYPLLQDLVETLRPFAPDTAAFDAFVEQWYFDVVLPEYRLDRAAVQEDGAGRVVTVRVTNVGTGRMPVEVAAVRGERFDDSGASNPEYRVARVRVELDAGEARTVRIPVDFAPERVVVDPDIGVLQLRRARAVADL